MSDQPHALITHAIELLQRERPTNARALGQALYHIQAQYGVTQSDLAGQLRAFQAFRRGRAKGLTGLMDRVQGKIGAVKDSVAQSYFKEVGTDQDYVYRYQEVQGRIKLAKERRNSLTQMLALISKENHLLKNQASRVARQYHLLKAEGSKDEETRDFVINEQY